MSGRRHTRIPGERLFTQAEVDQQVDRRVAFIQAANIRCTWPGCVNRKAGGEYGDDAPLCIGHIYETWRIARDLANSRQVRTPKTTIRLGPDLAPVEVERPVAHQGWIYYLRIGEHIKIGYASKLEQRLRSYPPNAELLAAHRGTKVDEQVTHSLLYVHRAAGREWYDPTPEVLDYIAKIRNRYGDPVDPRPKVTPKRQPVMIRARSGGRSSRR